MGVSQFVNHDKYPEQGSHLNKRVRVCFNYEEKPNFDGTVIRDDKTEPWRLIILLDNGRVILSTECQYILLPTPDVQVVVDVSA